MKKLFLLSIKKIIGKNSRNKGGMSSESISDLLSRLRRYDCSTKTYKIDVLSIPHALQMVLRLFPHKYCKNQILKEMSLRAFVTTIIPEADEDDKFLVEMYEDNFYPFHNYCGYFIFDLNKRAKKFFGIGNFCSLSLEDRTTVIQSALSGRELTVRLYKGAILMAQVAYFGAVYNEEKGCKLIAFPGRNNGYEKREITYPFAHSVFKKELSLSGHPW